MKKAEISIRFGTPENWEVRKVKALVNDRFAVHKIEGSDQYAVTHIRTGFKMPRTFVLHKNARNFAERMNNAVFPVHWDRFNIATNAGLVNNTFYKNGPKVKEILAMVDY